jgi:hypothetical protein
MIFHRALEHPEAAAGRYWRLSQGRGHWQLNIEPPWPGPGPPAAVTTQWLADSFTAGSASNLKLGGRMRRSMCSGALAALGLPGPRAVREGLNVLALVRA